MRKSGEAPALSAAVAYLDTSAFLKLVIAEEQSPALQAFLLRWPQRASADLLRTEAVRALRRAGYGDRVGAARRLFSSLRLIRLDAPLLDLAGDLNPRGLRSLDALHLAAALTIGDDLGVVVTYDARLAEAARERGLVSDSPS